MFVRWVMYKGALDLGFDALLAQLQRDLRGYGLIVSLVS